VLASQAARHTIAVTFDYDFGIIPACSSEVKLPCIQHFNLYDISAGIPNRVRLGSIPVPSGARGLVKGISGTSESHSFRSGKHMIAVSAQMPNGIESNLSECTTIVKIP
ncbi:MAG TPA: hypothetical protein VNO32_60760, partial [Candidatus Acidoferrum sp.]|nr:hypothetical protein [Candidatus Acidoferrum sp.]